MRVRAGLTAKDGPPTKADDALLKSITEGFQSGGSPLTLPDKGGNPALTEADIKAMLGYLRAEFSAYRAPKEGTRKAFRINGWSSCT